MYMYTARAETASLMSDESSGPWLESEARFISVKVAEAKPVTGYGTIH